MHIVITPGRENYPELDTQIWKKIIDRVWELRVPHVVFTGGEPTLRDDLVELVAGAQEKGLVTGLNTNGRKLADPSLPQELIEGLVWTMCKSRLSRVMHVCTTQWCEQAALGKRHWLAYAMWLPQRYMMTNTTLLQNNAFELERILEFLVAEGVPTVGLNALIYPGTGRKYKPD